MHGSCHTTSRCSPVDTGWAITKCCRVLNANNCPLIKTAALYRHRWSGHVLFMPAYRLPSCARLACALQRWKKLCSYQFITQSRGRKSLISVWVSVDTFRLFIVCASLSLTLTDSVGPLESSLFPLRLIKQELSKRTLAGQQNCLFMIKRFIGFLKLKLIGRLPRLAGLLFPTWSLFRPRFLLASELVTETKPFQSVRHLGLLDDSVCFLACSVSHPWLVSQSPESKSASRSVLVRLCFCMTHCN